MVSRRQFLRGDFSGGHASPGPGDAAAAGKAPRIAAACLAYANSVCRTCGDVCEAGAIRFRPRIGGAALPEVDDGKCTGCGDCAAACPASAIAVSQGKA